MDLIRVPVFLISARQMQQFFVRTPASAGSRHHQVDGPVRMVPCKEQSVCDAVPESPRSVWLWIKHSKLAGIA